MGGGESGRNTWDKMEEKKKIVGTTTGVECKKRGEKSVGKKSGETKARGTKRAEKRWGQKCG